MLESALLVWQDPVLVLCLKPVSTNHPPGLAQCGSLGSRDAGGPQPNYKSVQQPSSSPSS